MHATLYNAHIRKAYFGRGEEVDCREELIALRKSTGMNRKEFCEYFEIPYMTETDWELGKRRVPPYLLRLMTYKIHMEKLIKEKEELENYEIKKYTNRRK